MATRATTSGGAGGAYSVTSSQTKIDSLKTKMVKDAVINLTDINDLIDLWNAFNSHTHDIYEAYHLAEFGNNGDRNNYYQTTTTDGPNLNGDITKPVSGDQIKYDKVNELITAVADGANHSHTWADRIS